MGDPIRIGIVGSRFATQFHYTAYQRVTGINVEIVGVTSLTREHREDFAKKRGIKAFDSLEEMLPEVDVIDVCNPGYAHEEVSIASLEAGKHREPKSGMLAASDVVSVLYAAYISAERKGTEVEIPLDSSL